jgi:hypothetical protein
MSRGPEQNLHAPEASIARRDAGRWRFAGMLVLDVAAPLALYYVLRAVGATAWTALVVGATIPLLRLLVAAVTRRRPEAAGLFTLTLLAVGTAVGMLTAEPRLLMARESYVTAVAGAWILLSLRGRPLVYTATLRFVSGQAALSWRRAWDTEREFRRVMRGMTIAFGLAFLVDAAARVLMAYTIPLDLVPILSVVLLVGLLIGIVQAGKAYGKRHLGTLLAESPPTTEDGGSVPTVQKESHDSSSQGS